jgi:glyoxylase-like metal-dependent hydrolase (beta-lactamase superfamily II)
MRLTERIHLVASGDGGFSLTDPFDCHVYAVDGGDEAALIDSGIGAATEDILRNLEQSGIPPARVRRVLLTHAHPDHAGGAASLSERLPGLRVVASAQVADWVETANEHAMSVEAGKRAQFYPADFRARPCPVDERVADRHRLRVGDLELEVIETPGHAAGHLAFVADTPDGRACFCGDLVFFGGLVSLESNWDCSLQDYQAGLRRLDGAGIDALLPGHHSISLRRGQRHVDAANRLFARGFVPPSVV